MTNRSGLRGRNRRTWSCSASARTQLPQHHPTGVDERRTGIDAELAAGSMQEDPHGGVGNSKLVGDELVVVSQDGVGDDLPFALAEMLGTRRCRVIPAGQEMAPPVALLLLDERPLCR